MRSPVHHSLHLFERPWRFRVGRAAVDGQFVEEIYRGVTESQASLAHFSPMLVERHWLLRSVGQVAQILVGK